MKYNNDTYTAKDLSRDFIFGVMWHVCPAKKLDVTKEEDVILAVNNAYRDMMPRTIAGIGLSNLDKANHKSIRCENKDEKRALLDKKEELRQTKEQLLNELRKNLAKKVIKTLFKSDRQFGKKSFDKAHQKLCRYFIADFKAKMEKLNGMIREYNQEPMLPEGAKLSDIDTDGTITYGKAQKIVNMTMKQLYCFDNASDYKDTVFKFCHIPIDSIILDFFQIKNCGNWSSFNDAKYKYVQRMCRERWDEAIKGLNIEEDFKHLFFSEFIIWAAASENAAKEKDERVYYSNIRERIES